MIYKTGLWTELEDSWKCLLWSGGLIINTSGVCSWWSWALSGIKHPVRDGTLESSHVVQVEDYKKERDSCPCRIYPCEISWCLALQQQKEMMCCRQGSKLATTAEELAVRVALSFYSGWKAFARCVVLQRGLSLAMNEWGTQVVGVKLQLVESGGWQQGLGCLGGQSLSVRGRWGVVVARSQLHSPPNLALQGRSERPPAFPPRSLLGYPWLLLKSLVFGS